MDLGRWLKELEALHAKARTSTLPAAEQREYRARREELARALRIAQGMGRQPGQARRQSLRVARALQVEIAGAGRTERLTTFDVSAGGFSAPMAAAPPPGELLTATLRLPEGEQLRAPVRVAGVAPASGHVRVSFAFGPMPGADSERLERAILDMVLAQLRR